MPLPKATPTAAQILDAEARFGHLRDGMRAAVLADFDLLLELGRAGAKAAARQKKADEKVLSA